MRPYQQMLSPSWSIPCSLQWSFSWAPWRADASAKTTTQTYVMICGKNCFWKVGLTTFYYYKSWRIALLLPSEHLEEAFQVAGWQHEKMCQKFLRCIQDPLLSVSQAPRPRSLYPAHQMSSWDWSPSWIDEDSLWAGWCCSSQLAISCIKIESKHA